MISKREKIQKFINSLVSFFFYFLILILILILLIFILFILLESRVQVKGESNHIQKETEDGSSPLLWFILNFFEQYLAKSATEIGNIPCFDFYFLERVPNYFLFSSLILMFFYLIIN